MTAHCLTVDTLSLPNVTDGPIATPPDRVVGARVQEVFPETGLAYAVDGEGITWTITRSTRGMGIDTLRADLRLSLRVVEYGDFAFVTDYRSDACPPLRA